MKNYKEILRQHYVGNSNAVICTNCNCSESTVTRTIALANKLSLNSEKLSGMTNEDVEKLLHPLEIRNSGYALPDCEYLINEMTKPGVTLQLLHDEYRAKCIASGQKPYQITQFKKYYHDAQQKTKATLHLEHKRGDILQTDWAGTTLTIQNRITGEVEKAYLFVATLLYSGYTYAEAFLSMNLEAWITAHIHAYTFFGGSTRLLVPDNLKTGVLKNSKEETILNPAYEAMGIYYNTSILPARVRAPKDKAAVEGTVGNLTTSVIARLRNHQYFSLWELNEDIAYHLKNFNEKPFQKKEGSRRSLFEEEKPYLRPIPLQPYEIAVNKVAKVQYNYHISLDGNYYSCPYLYIQKKVNLRLTRNTVEIFYNGERIASHLRLEANKGAYSTVFEHMPPNHQQYSQWNEKRFRKWALSIGEYTSDTVEYFLTSPSVPEQGYKVCMALLRLPDVYSKERVEAACEKVWKITHNPTLKLIKTALEDTNHEVGNTETMPSRYGILRGSEYYKNIGGRHDD